MDLDLKDCDILPLIPIIKGAGAKIIKLDGTHNNIVACVAELADTVESLMPWKDIHGAGEGIRTLDIHLGKVVLYQLSYARKWGS